VYIGRTPSKAYRFKRWHRRRLTLCRTLCRWGSSSCLGHRLFQRLRITRTSTGRGGRGGRTSTSRIGRTSTGRTGRTGRRTRREGSGPIRATATVLGRGGFFEGFFRGIAHAGQVKALNNFNFDDLGYIKVLALNTMEFYVFGSGGGWRSRECQALPRVLHTLNVSDLAAVFGCLCPLFYAAFPLA
jgi:hypothetical protein